MRTLENLQLQGGCLVFDFTNTVNTRKPVPEYEYLQTYDDFLEWSAKAGALTGHRFRVLKERASLEQASALAALGQVIAVRENLYRLFTAIASGNVPEAAVVSAFNERLSLTFQKINVGFGTAGAEVCFKDDEIALDEPLNLVIQSAFEVLTRQDFSRLRACPRCGWLFLDTSKNGKRKWCDMNVCGSREKALEYYYRKTKTA
nr:CGNR zinc finger domain-containing protein [uncultured Dyadobacter sp.]